MFELLCYIKALVRPDIASNYAGEAPGNPGISSHGTGCDISSRFWCWLSLQSQSLCI